MVNGDSFYAGGLATIFIYVFVGALVSVLLFPFALGFSIRRTDFFAGSVLMLVLYSIFTSIILLVLAEVERSTGSWGNRVSFFKLPYLNDGTLLEQFMIYFIVLISFAFIGIGIGVFYLRHRGMKTFVMFAAYFILLSGPAFWSPNTAGGGKCLTGLSNILPLNYPCGSFRSRSSLLSLVTVRFAKAR